MVTKKIMPLENSPPQPSPPSPPPPTPITFLMVRPAYNIRSADSLSWDTLDDRRRYVNSISMYRKPSIHVLGGLIRDGGGLII